MSKGNDDDDDEDDDDDDDDDEGNDDEEEGGPRAERAPAGQRQAMWPTWPQRVQRREGHELES